VAFVATVLPNINSELSTLGACASVLATLSTFAVDADSLIQNVLLVANEHIEIPLEGLLILEARQRILVRKNGILHVVPPSVCLVVLTGEKLIPLLVVSVQTLQLLVLPVKPKSICVNRCSWRSTRWRS
jgi:hypothetical protein